MQLLESFYTVRFSDCDPFRHLNNARYIDYMLNAREDHLKENYNMDLASFYKQGVGWVVVKHEINYVRPASINERICVRSGLLESSSDHLLVEMLMLDENTSHLKAILHTKFVPVNLTTGKRESHGSDFMEFIADKHLPGIAESISLVDRIHYWQTELKSVSTS